MNIAGPFQHRPFNDGVHKADGGGFGSTGLLGLDHLGGDDVRAGIPGLPLHILDGPGGAFAAVEGVDGLLHGLPGGDHRHHLLVGGVLDLLLGHKVQGVAHGHIQFVLHQLHRHHAVAPGDGTGYEFGHFQRNGHGGQVDIIHAQLHLQGLDELLLRNEALLDEHVAQTALAALLKFQGPVQLLRGNGSGGDEQVAQTHISHRIFLLEICRFCRGF